MKFAISAAALILVLGTGASAYAGQDKGQGNHSQAGHQEAKPAQAQARPEHQAAKPAQQQHTQQQARPAEQQRAQTQVKPEQQHAQAKPAQQQHAQKEARPAQHAQQASRSQAQPTHAANRAPANRGGNQAHGRISNAHYASSFGSGHRFHVSEGDYRNRRFSYGGYSFGFIDPWPVGWGYSDDVYVVFVDGGYYMYDPIHPGVRISLNIL